MPYYKHFQDEFSYSLDATFDKILKPGDLAEKSGIYRCMKCGWEETSVAKRALPPQNSHAHTKEQGEIEWRLSAAAKHESKK